MKSSTPTVPSKPLADHHQWSDKIDIKKINAGGLFRAGSFDSKRNTGLKGQLGKLKRSYRQTDTANLSQGNLEYIYDKIAKAMKANPASSSAGITRLQEKQMMYKAWQDVKKGTLHSEDFKDFRAIIKSIRAQYKEQAFSRVRDQSSTQTSPTAATTRSASTANSLTHLTPLAVDGQSPLTPNQKPPKAESGDVASVRTTPQLSAETKAEHDEEEEPRNLLSRAGTPGIKEEAEKAIDLPIG